MENPPRLGRLCAGTEPRDAVHVAVVVATAGEILHPGRKVFVLKNKTADMPAVEYVARAADGETHEPVGVVDPFLPLPVGVGQQFYLLLKPLTVTGLRHDWTHPAFDSVPVRPTHKNERVATSVKWIEDFAARVGIGYVTLVSGAFFYLGTGKTLLRHPPTDYVITHQELLFFWHHYGVLTDTDTTGVNPEFIVTPVGG